jgi:ABC-2 type transport system ATP-binding protein
MRPVIELDKVTKMYGSVRGVEDVTLEVMPGAVYGFLGPNGAGKSTTINMLVDMLRPTSGNIKIFGLDSVKDSVEIRKRIGFLAGDIALDRGLTGWQQLEYFGNLRGSFDKKYIEELAKRLDCNLNRKFGTLSRGNKQKVGLIAALMHKPDLLILDEPTSGLDPLMQQAFNDLIAVFKKEGKTAFISSHILSEVQEICDQVAFIKDGHMVAESSIHELSAGLPKQVMITSKDKKLASALKKLKGFNSGNITQDTLNGTYAGDTNELISLLSKHKIDSLQMQEADLETAFMKFYSQSEPDNAPAASSQVRSEPTESREK